MKLKNPFLKTALLAVVLSGLASHVLAQNPGSSEKKFRQVKSVRTGAVELHYVESGKGVPVIFVHGSLDDYRLWEPQIDAFAEQYHVIAYSRRYNYPNKNGDIRPDHSAIVEAEDLADLIKKLKLPPAHVVGHSYGAFTALFLALKYPKLVRALVLAEPPVLRWAQDRPQGKFLYDTFINGTWKPVGDEFRRGERERALRLTLNYFLGEDVFDQIPEAQRNYWMQNIREWHALTTSSDPFPPVPRSRVKSIKMPVMMLSGGRTLELLKFVDSELEPLLAKGERVVLPNATHEMWAEQPEESRRAVLAFLGRH
jgi:non-heme chloroperoxidase